MRPPSPRIDRNASTARGSMGFPLLCPSPTPVKRLPTAVHARHPGVDPDRRPRYRLAAFPEPFMPTVGLFVPCYVEQFYPQVRLATLDVLQRRARAPACPLAPT